MGILSSIFGMGKMIVPFIFFLLYTMMMFHFFMGTIKHFRLTEDAELAEFLLVCVGFLDTTCFGLATWSIYNHNV